MEKLTDYEKEIIRLGEEDFAAGRYSSLEEVEARLDEKIRVAKLMLKNKKKAARVKKVHRPLIVSSQSSTR